MINDPDTNVVKVKLVVECDGKSHTMDLPKSFPITSEFRHDSTAFNSLDSVHEMAAIIAPLIVLQLLDLKSPEFFNQEDDHEHFAAVYNNPSPQLMTFLKTAIQDIEK